VVDGALWHNSKAGEGFDNLTLLKLPPASPELNPIEQVWQYLRQHHLANRCFDGYQHILEVCCEAWNVFAQNPKTIASITQRKWATLED